MYIYVGNCIIVLKLIYANLKICKNVRMRVWHDYFRLFLKIKIVCQVSQGIHYISHY